jgi:uncharacterized protein YaeQ
MALKPTIYKFNLNLSDLNNDHYQNLNLTLALHPSETLERMMARVMAYCLNVYRDDKNQQGLRFTKGLSEVEQPDIWLRNLDDSIDLWIDLGEPEFERMKKACRQAKQTLLYSFNSKSDVWWSQSQSKFKKLDLCVSQFDWTEIQALAALVERTMHASITITGSSAYVAAERSEVEVSWQELQA